jgi:hypothetical protein
MLMPAARLASRRRLLMFGALLLGLIVTLPLVSGAGHPAHPAGSRAGVAAPLAPAASATPCPPGWPMVTSPNPPDTTVSAVRGIAAIGPDDIWATGYSTQDRATWNTLIEHWDGAAWTIVPGAVTPAPKNWLLGAGGLTTDDVWAVGQFAYDTYRGSLIEHWDGQVWSVVPEPSRPGYGSYLTGVAPIARDDVWAVGEQRYYDGPEQGLIVHWDGTAWAVVPGANGNWVDSLLWAVSATGPRMCGRSAVTETASVALASLNTGTVASGASSPVLTRDRAATSFMPSLPGRPLMSGPSGRQTAGRPH